MANQPLKWTDWRVHGIFANQSDRRELIEESVSRFLDYGCKNVVYLRSKTNKLPPLYPQAFYLEDMSTKRSNNFLAVADLVTPSTVLIFDDIETIRNYPQSMTRNIINHLIHLTPYKITGGSALVTNHMYDLYSQFAVLDKLILYASHYWCYKDDHREVSVFDGCTVFRNKDHWYTAKKLIPFIYFDLEPQNRVQDYLYNALRVAPYQERVQNLSKLRLI